MVSPQTLDYIRQKLNSWDSFRVEIQNYRKDGTSFWVELNIQPVSNEFGYYTHWISIQRDISGRKKIELQREESLDLALKLANRDPLTGVLNYRAFRDQLKLLGSINTPSECVVVAMIDLDNFKFFNDVYGHRVGDQVLIQVAQALQDACPPSAHLGRMGGDEFAFLLPCTDRDEAIRAIESLQRVSNVIGYTPPDYPHPIPLTMSFGIAIWPEDAPTLEGTLTIADKRLLSAKNGDANDEADQIRDHLCSTSKGFGMLHALVVAVDNKDRYTRKHSEEVMFHSVAIGRQLGLDTDTIDDLKVAALLHDVGKIGVPDRILRRPGRLTADEVLVMQQHPILGYTLALSIPELSGALDGIRHHHESWDGTGYPDGLSAEEIPLTARILAVADAYSAMTTNRPYRKAFSVERAFETLSERAGNQWDSTCVAAFFAAYGRVFRTK